MTKPTAVTELSIIGDHLGAIRDLLALISRQIEAPNNDIAKACARLSESDPHQFSNRPCSTCRSISALLGEPYGCVRRESKQR